MDDRQWWLVLANETLGWETEAASAEEAIWHVRMVMMPEEPPDAAPGDYDVTSEQLRSAKAAEMMCHFRIDAPRRWLLRST
jgi:hypothetical protein